MRDLLTAELLTAGFHQHDGMWRRRGNPRGGSTSTLANDTLTTPRTAHPMNTEPDLLLPIRKLLEQARRGDVTCLPTLRQALDVHPGIWTQAIARAESFEDTLLQAITEGDTLYTAALRGQVDVMRQAADCDTALEHLLEEHHIAAWLYHRRAEQRLTAEPESRRLQRAARAARRRLDRAERRLANIGRLLRRRHAQEVEGC